MNLKHFVFFSGLMLLVWSCSGPNKESPVISTDLQQTPEPDLLQRFLGSDTLGIDTSHPLLIHAISPADCINCYIILKYYLKAVDESPQPDENLIFVLPKIRKVELDKVFYRGLQIPKGKFTVISDDALYRQCIAEGGLTASPSLLLSYDLPEQTPSAHAIRKLDINWVKSLLAN